MWIACGMDALAFFQRVLLDAAALESERGLPLEDVQLAVVGSDSQQ
jgi:hypothetical protein